MVFPLSLTVSLLIFCCSPALGAEDDDELTGALYRYRDQNGVLVIDFSVPPQYVGEGYDILSANGMLIRRVPPRSEQEAAISEGGEAREEQEKEDAYILSSYSTVEDVERAKDRRLQMLEREINILKANQEELARREGDLKERAAAYQASGKKPPATISSVLEDLGAQQENVRELLRERRRQYLEVARRYDSQAKRLLELRPDAGNANN